METHNREDGAIKIPGDIMHPKCRILFRFWEASRGERAAANKQTLKLGKIAKILPNIAILERHPSRQVYNWRLAGSGICELWGRELTGTQILSDWPEFERQTMASGFDMVVAMLQPFVARFKVTTGTGNELGVELLALPIQDEITGVLQILAAIVPFRHPEWIGEDHIVNYELATVRRIWSDALPQDKLSGKIAFGKRQTRQSPPFLQVIEGGRRN